MCGNIPRIAANPPDLFVWFHSTHGSLEPNSSLRILVESPKPEESLKWAYFDSDPNTTSRNAGIFDFIEHLLPQTTRRLYMKGNCSTPPSPSSHPYTFPQPPPQADQHQWMTPKINSIKISSSSRGQVALGGDGSTTGLSPFVTILKEQYQPGLGVNAWMSKVNTQNARAVELLQHAGGQGAGAGANSTFFTKTERLLGSDFSLASLSGRSASEVSRPLFDVFLSHKQAHAQDLAKAFKERYQGSFKCFLDRDYNGDLHHLVDIVGRSRCLMLFLTRDVFDSPWCMLELLSAVMNKVPIVLFKVEGHGMREVGFPDKLETMGFPGAEHIKGINVIPHSRNYFDACMAAVHERVAGHIASRPTPRSIVTPSEVHAEFELLRQRRNQAFPGLPDWRPLG